MTGALDTPSEVFSWAESFTNYEKGSLPTDKRLYRLERMRALLGLFGDPDRDLRIVHVAGTKGKGSTSALIANVLNAAGSITGLYLSPHVESPFERMEIAGRERRPELLVKMGRQAKAAVDSLPGGMLPGGFAPTTFELYTLLAFLYFREAGCTEAVVEVGIGGRLDATNVVRPRASVITPLDFDHTDILGDTIEKIASEKAGIIKSGAPAFVGRQSPRAKEVIGSAARECGSPISFLDEEIEELDTHLDAHGTSFAIRLKGERREEFRLSLLGDFQAENAALAYLTLRRTRPEIPLSAFREGFLAARLPGRMELRAGSPPLVLDGAHTPLAVSRLLSSFKKIFPGEAILLFGSVTGKKPREMAEILAPGFSRIIVSRPGTFKESQPEEVAGIFCSLRPDTILEKDPRKALDRAIEESAGRIPILVTGSFYMVSEIRRLL